MSDPTICRTCLRLRQGLCDGEKDQTVCPSYKQMTNADRIRAMTDEELANSLFFKERLGHSCNKEKCKKHGEEEKGFANCEECLLDWLKQEVSE